MLPRWESIVFRAGGMKESKDGSDKNKFRGRVRGSVGIDRRWLCLVMIHPEIILLARSRHAQSASDAIIVSRTDRIGRTNDTQFTTSKMRLHRLSIANSICMRSGRGIVRWTLDMSLDATAAPDMVDGVSSLDRLTCCVAVQPRERLRPTLCSTMLGTQRLWWMKCLAMVYTVHVGSTVRSWVVLEGSKGCTSV